MWNMSSYNEKEKHLFSPQRTFQIRYQILFFLFFLHQDILCSHSQGIPQWVQLEHWLGFRSGPTWLLPFQVPIGRPSLAPVLLTTGLSIQTSPVPAHVHSVPWSLAIAGEMSPVLYTYIVKGKEWRHLLDSSRGAALSVEGPVPVEVRNTGLLAHKCINLARNSPRRLPEAPLHGHSWISHWPLVTKSLSSPPPIPES